MCPDRHFATGEILGFVACVVMRLEVDDVDEKVIKVPAFDEYILPVHILEPVAGEPVRVRLRLREGEDGRSIQVVP